MKITVIKDEWNNKACYVGFIQFEDIGKIIDATQDQAMNRLVKEKRVDNISTYIQKEKKKCFFPPVVLNCRKRLVFKEINNNVCEIDIEKKSLTIIDGQHRINAINKAMGTCNEIKNNNLPFILIENIEEQEHRNLFNLINENSVNVESTVSARFDISKENLFGLRFVHEEMEHGQINIKDLIEWEAKQSTDKVCYLFITQVNKKFINHMHTTDDEEIYSILKLFWITYFNKIINLTGCAKKFYVKKVTLMAICKHILDNSTLMEELEEKITKAIEELILDEFKNEYKDGYTQSNNTYNNIIEFLKNEKECISDKEKIAI
ncbi:DGQHR domain-containing protein [Tepidibacter aestuarii]|uniref:DGQHR domain-containing protein n=1 Tax=Tepidibacter aestuarii TaxID=2925782 RepID=UPI0020C06727|nr:DGQHR domain-containing protein [Tepidibacter aestuarii]CAH2213353.1 protein of unknown function [Tepidibacter aestuarii]